MWMPAILDGKAAAGFISIKTVGSGLTSIEKLTLSKSKVKPDPDCRLFELVYQSPLCYGKIMKKLPFLYLTDDDVRRLVSMKDAIKIAREAFAEKGRGRVDMPPKIYLSFQKFSGDLRIMPSYFMKKNICGVKIVNSHSLNPSKFSLPSVMAKVILVHPETGVIYALLEATYLTALRTGAAGALAISFLARKNSRAIGFIGSGVQAATQLQGALQVLKNVRDIYVFGKDSKSLKRFSTEAKKSEKNVHPCHDAEEVCRHSDVLVTTTPSTSPVLRAAWIKEGTHINAIGADAPGKQELEIKIIQSSNVVVDDLEQCVNAGEINVSVRKKALREKDIHAELSEIVCGRKKGRTRDNEITVFDSTGVSILDVLTSYTVYKKAAKSLVFSGGV